MRASGVQHLYALKLTSWHYFSLDRQNLICLFAKYDVTKEIISREGSSKRRECKNVKEGVKLVHKAEIKTMIDEDYSGSSLYDSLRRNETFYQSVSCLPRGWAKEDGETEARESPVIVIIFSMGTNLCNAPRRLCT